MPESLHTLLHRIVDYAGLFPPAALPMDQAVANYALYRRDPHAWMLARLIVPVARLAEFEAAAAPLLPRSAAPWLISALAGEQLAADLAAIAEFNARHAHREPLEGGEQPAFGAAAFVQKAGTGTRINADEHGQQPSIRVHPRSSASNPPNGEQSRAALIDTLELRAADTAAIDAIAQQVPPGLMVFVELPIHADPRALVDRLAAHGLRAKVRSGGVLPEQFPPAADLLRFIAACVAAGLPFKATAGLHHPLRASYRLTYAPNSPSGMMYGYLNVFLATAFLQAGMPQPTVLAVLCETEPGAFAFDEAGASWRGARLTNAQLASTRAQAALTFGSCSFREPVDELLSFEF